MTSFSVDTFDFTDGVVEELSGGDRRFMDWPVVYVLGAGNSRRSTATKSVYVGETLNAAKRMRQHLATEAKQGLSTLRLIVDPTFNKSVCLDLESYLIRMLAGDGSYSVLNRNAGITEADYFDREKYRQTFSDVFEQLREEGVFTRTIPEIVNSDLFKLSPFKALTEDQASAVEDIVEGLLKDFEAERPSSIVIQGAPGTGKTIVAIYLLKLLVDIARSRPDFDADPDTRFADFFAEGNPELLRGLRVALVIPQQSLRESVRNVFRKTPGLDPTMVMTAFDVGSASEDFDLVIIDEAHRLNQRANQPSGVQNARFRDITVALFGSDDHSKTQLDWIRAKSKHQILLLDSEQSVRPADLPLAAVRGAIQQAEAADRHYRLRTQMRVSAGSDYVSYIRRILDPNGHAFGVNDGVIESFEGYDFRIFDELPRMHEAIRRRDEEVGLSRLVAGFAWEWKTKNDRSAFDIEIDGYQLRWNGTQRDWIASATALEEVGSIHTVQGYDLNYAGVIIGGDLRYDKTRRRLFMDRSSYFDKKGMENNARLGITYTDDDLLRFVRNIYGVLLTRGMRGTYVYVVDDALREYLRAFIPSV